MCKHVSLLLIVVLACVGPPHVTCTQTNVVAADAQVGAAAFSKWHLLQRLAFQIAQLAAEQAC